MTDGIRLVQRHTARHLTGKRRLAYASGRSGRPI
jgi:hypothetical protein